MVEVGDVVVVVVDRDDSAACGEKGCSPEEGVLNCCCDSCDGRD